jgi:hypothetical protein
VDLHGEDASQNFGNYLSFSSDGTTLAIAADGVDNGTAENTGRVRVYQSSNGTWTQQGADILGEAAGDRMGHGGVSLASNGTVMAIGAWLNDGGGSDAGHVRVYQYNGAWIQLGGDINGEMPYDHFGFKVALSSDGMTMASGAPGNDGGGAASGHVRVYKYSSFAAQWTKLGADIDGVAGSMLGADLSLSNDGTIVATGARNASTTNIRAGHVRIYKYNHNSNAWVQLGADIKGTSAYNHFGSTVSISGDGSRVAGGAKGNGNAGTSYVRVHQYDSTSDGWTQIGADIDGENVGSSRIMVSLSNDGTALAIGNYRDVRAYRFSASGWSQIGAAIAPVGVVINGDFSSSTNPSMGAYDDYDVQDGDFPSWSIEGNIRHIKWRTWTWNRPLSSDGYAAGYLIALHSIIGGTLRQNITGLVVGQTFSLGWSERCRYGHAARKLQVSVGGVVVAGHAVPSLWTRRAVHFVATSTEMLVEFQDKGGNSGSVLLDTITMSLGQYSILLLLTAPSSSTPPLPLTPPPPATTTSTKTTTTTTACYNYYNYN